MSVTVIFNLAMTTRDGVKLYADVYLPAPTGKFPLIVLRSPYNSDTPGYSQYCADFCEQGIGVVCQAVRGTAVSEGEMNVSSQECDDGEDFLEWIAAQDFCNGNIVTNGESYPGHTQWQVARHAHPVLKGTTPHNAPLDFYPVAMRPGGAWGFGLATIWAFGVRSRRCHLTQKTPWKDAQWHLPLKTMDEVVLGEEWPLWRKWMEHVCRDEFWQGKSDAFSDIEKMTAPAFITGGWFDAFLPQTLEAFAALRKHGATEQVRNFTRCVIEPLDHDMRTHEVDYGPDHLAGIIETRNRFMKERLFSPDKDPLPEQPPIRFFVMGSNRWMDADEWPLPQTVYTKMYLHGASPANTATWAGQLEDWVPFGMEPADHFIYNPLQPVPTQGGNNLGFIAPGQRLQEEIEKRADVLVYTSAPMSKDTDMIGHVTALIYAATDGFDTDFTVKICDVSPDGKSYNICDGLKRGRFLQGTDKERLLEPNRVYPYEIDCWYTAWTFLKGHCIRVQVSSSNFPRFDRNLNTGMHLTESSEMRVAFQTVYHDMQYPSCVILPIIPS